LLLDANWFRIKVQVKKVAKGLLRSSYTPVKNSKRLLCRFFIMVSGQQELGMVIKQTSEKGLTRWYRGEGMVIPMFRDPVILGIQEPTKLNARVAERKSLPLFPRPMTKNCCAWSASTVQRYQRRNDE